MDLRGGAPCLAYFIHIAPEGACLKKKKEGILPNTLVATPVASQFLIQHVEVAL